MGKLSDAVDTLKTTYDSLKTIADLEDAIARRNAIIDLQAKIVSAQAGAVAAQSEQAEMADEIRQLKAHVAQFETWEAEKKRYELVEVRPGVRIYAIKESERGTEPQHHICATCFANGKKSILQSQMWQPFRCDMLICHECGSFHYLSGHASQEHEKLRPKRR